MRKPFGQSLRIGIAPRGLALLATSRWRAAEPQVLAERRMDSAQTPEQLAGALRELLAEAGCAKRPATIVLADELVRIWQVKPAPGSTRLADLEAAAALRFQALYGEAAGAWQLAAGWDPAQPFLAAAMPRQLLVLLEAAASAQHVTLVEIVPQFIAGWNQWRGALKAGAWYGLVHEGVLTLGAVDGGAIAAVRAQALPDGASLDWLDQHIAREALRLNLSPPARLMVSGHAPAAWNNSSGKGIACSVLGQGADQDWSGAVRLAATGSRA